MITHLCDRCGRPIESEDTRYIARIQVLAAADPLEISAEELQEDAGDEMDRLLKQCAEMTEEELMQDVFVEFRFDLCRRCQRAYIANPLGVTE
jgi:hypothetical protein